MLAEGPSLVIGGAADRDILAATAAGLIGRPLISKSRSTAAGWCAATASAAGMVGVDIETIARIGLNATPRDRWLASAERVLVDAASDRTVELACHWVLKEAYGKALGVGLALPLELLAFRGRAGDIVLEGVAAPPAWERWSFRLYRHADVIVGLAFQAMPLAPAGRKPPTPLLDR